MKKASETYLKGVLEYTKDEVVSSDFIHCAASSIFDAGSGIGNTSRIVSSGVVTHADIDISANWQGGTNGLGTYTRQTTPVPVVPDVPVELTVDGLSANTRYYYRLVFTPAGGSAGSVAERSFQTARTPGSTFVFGLQGDSHPERVRQQFDSTLYVRTLQAAAGSPVLSERIELTREGTFANRFIRELGVRLPLALNKRKRIVQAVAVALPPHVDRVMEHGAHRSASRLAGVCCQQHVGMIFRCHVIDPGFLHGFYGPTAAGKEICKLSIHVLMITDFGYKSTV